MAKLVSSWCNDLSLPENYIVPPEKRPGNVIVPLCNSIPVVDLEDSRAEIIQQILRASREFGFFQVINHGVSESLMEDAMSVCKEVFEMPVEYKASLYSEERNRGCRLFTSSYQFLNQQTRYWRDILGLPCHPLEDCIKLWPPKPTTFREVVRKYSTQVKKLSSRILELICEGLELDPRYLEGELGKVQFMAVNHYPPCPDPSLTLGIVPHCDPNLLTVLLQEDVYGLQVLKDGQWIGVEPLPNAFVINIGSTLQIISNGILKSAEHRAVTNSSKARTSIASFVAPSNESIIEPAKGLIDASRPALYRAFLYPDIGRSYAAHHGNHEKILDDYKLQS